MYGQSAKLCKRRLDENKYYNSWQKIVESNLMNRSLPRTHAEARIVTKANYFSVDWHPAATIPTDATFPEINYTY